MMQTEGFLRNRQYQTMLRRRAPRHYPRGEVGSASPLGCDGWGLSLLRDHQRSDVRLCGGEHLGTDLYLEELATGE